jgi:hypothetical protein
MGSIEKIEAWEPDSLGLTHFDSVDDVPAHMAVVRERLAEQAARAREMDAEEFEATLIADVERESGAEAAEAMVQAVPPDQQWAGLRRYWDKRG